MMSRADCCTMISEKEVFWIGIFEINSLRMVTVAPIDGEGDGIVVNAENGSLSEQCNAERLSGRLTRINRMDKETVKQMGEDALPLYMITVTAKRLRDT